MGGDDENTKMLHFRTLDWGMDALRKVIVHLDFVEKDGGHVIVRTSRLRICADFLPSKHVPTPKLNLR